MHPGRAQGCAHQRIALPFRVAAAALSFAATPALAAIAVEHPAVFGIPVDFILFAITLLGVALFRHYTLYVALAGLATIALYKLGFTGFKTGEGIPGLIGHLQHEWVILTNLLFLLLGFALLSKHFEESKVPAVLPKYLPGDWKGPFVLLAVLGWQPTPKRGDAPLVTPPVRAPNAVAAVARTAPRLDAEQNPHPCRRLGAIHGPYPAMYEGGRKA